MSTTIRVSARPAGFTLWTAALSALAAAALIMSAVALTVAARDRAVTGVAGGGIHEAASTEAPLWDAGKLAAMQGRVLAESVRSEGYAPLWDEGKLEAMKGRVLAESPGSGIPLCSGTRAGSRPWQVVFWPGSSRFEPAGRVQVHEWPGGTERAGRLGFCNRARTAVLRILASTDAGKVR